jgi:hypothetical protein
MDSAMHHCDGAVKPRLGSRRLAPERHLRHRFAICLGRCGNHPIAHHQGLAPADGHWPAEGQVQASRFENGHGVRAPLG